jgi:hypothetical protein
MYSKVVECDDCNRLYDIIVNDQCPACETVPERAGDGSYSVTTSSEDGSSAGS